MYTSKNNAKNFPHTTVDLSSASSDTLLDLEMIKIFERSILENRPYLIHLDNGKWVGWIKRRREYWEREKGVSVTYHILSNSVYVVPMR